jgi:hypothetical protein
MESRDLIQRNTKLLMSLPSYVRYSEKMWSSHNPAVVFRAAQEYLDILYNEFMVRRMMVARLGEDHTQLLHLAHQILKTVLEATSVRGARGTNVGCVPWIVRIATLAPFPFSLTFPFCNKMR